MHLVALLPIRPVTSIRIYNNVIRRAVDDFGLGGFVLGLNEDDAIGKRAAAHWGAHVIRIAASDPFRICSLWFKMAEYATSSMDADVVMLTGDVVSVVVVG